MFIRIRFKSNELDSQRFIPYQKRKQEDADYIAFSENIDFFIEFSNEDLKNELGNNVKNSIKQLNQDEIEKEFYEHFSVPEMKYRVAKTIESIFF